MLQIGRLDWDYTLKNLLKQTILILSPDWPESVYFLRRYDHIKNHLNLNIFGGGKKQDPRNL